MTQCCDTWGNCNQGRDCPARTGVVLPHQAAHAAKVRRTCAELGVFQDRGGCDCADTVPPQAGTFQITYEGKDEGEWQAVTMGDAWRWLRPTLPVLGCVLLLVTVAGLGMGYITERHADVLWQLLSGVS